MSPRLSWGSALDCPLPSAAALASRVLGRARCRRREGATACPWLSFTQSWRCARRGLLQTYILLVVNASDPGLLSIRIAPGGGVVNVAGVTSNVCINLLPHKFGKGDKLLSGCWLLAQFIIYLCTGSGCILKCWSRYVFQGEKVLREKPSLQWGPEPP